MNTEGPQANGRRFHPGWSLALGIGLSLAVLAGAIGLGTLRLRRHIREQIVARDGETLDAVAAMQYLDDKTSDETVAGLEDPGEQLQLAMKISRLHNVMGVRLFAPDGTFENAIPAYITEGTLTPEEVARLRALKPVSHFLPQARLDQQDLLTLADRSPVPLLVVNVPLHEEGSTRLAGVAQFLMNGGSIAREYRDLDVRLVAQSALAFILGGGILAGGLVLAFWRVQRANRLLAERTANLLRANRELALAAKTSAVGALTSHLIHGLRNPLSGLQSFVQDRAAEPCNGHDTDWQLAVATTKRMEDMINRVVQVLQEQPAGADYEVTLAELAEMLGARCLPAARAAGVRFDTAVRSAGVLTNRESDLVLFILENLVQNALEATPPGKAICLRIGAENGMLAMEVQDEGPGLPAEVAARLFTPCASTKKGGSGIGLAISRQLASHLGGQLELKTSSAQGCTFRLALRATPTEPEKQRQDAAVAN